MIADRVDAVRDRIARAAARARRRPEDVTLVAVSKTHPAEAVREAFAAGLRHFGENKVQEAEGKIAALAALRAEGLRWHLVGHLQSNKARAAAVALRPRRLRGRHAGSATRLEKGAEQAKKHGARAGPGATSARRRPRPASTSSTSSPPSRSCAA